MSESNGARKLRLAEEFEGESGAVEGEVDLSGLEYPQDGEDVNVTHLVKSINYTAEHNDQRYRHQFEVPVYLVVAGEGRHAIMTGDRELLDFSWRGYRKAQSYGDPTLGWYPERVTGPPYPQACELCCVADMIMIAIK